MPNQPRPDNPGRNIRIPDHLWAAAKKRGHERGEQVSQVVRRALEEYVK